MDLSVPCIVEGRSELRNVSRVNCKTHWLFRAVEHLTYWTNISHCRILHCFSNVCSALGWECFYYLLLLLLLFILYYMLNSYC